MQQTAICLVLLTLSVLTGCRTVADSWQATTVAVRGRQDAERSWQESQPIYAGVRNLSTFAEGYKAGYRHAASGRDANQPPFPPHGLGRGASGRRENPAIVQTWVDGYSHGALAASQERVVQHNTFDTVAIQQAVAAPPTGASQQETTIPHAAQPQDSAVPPLPVPFVGEIHVTEDTEPQTVTHMDASATPHPVARNTAPAGTE